MTNKKINGLLLVNQKSGIKARGGKFIPYYEEKDIGEHYFSKEYKIYSDKLSKFVVKCNGKVTYMLLIEYQHYLDIYLLMKLKIWQDMI